jgi:hypothetical protein
MASTYLTRTPSSAGNRKTWTWSGWVKTATTSGDKGIFSASTDASNRNAINLSNEGYFIFDYEVGGTRNVLSSQNATYRDVSGWYHLVVAVDTTQATDTNRVKMYVNGSQITLTGVVNNYPSQNADMFVNNTVSHSIGRQDWGTSYFDGSMAHVHLIDGTAYDADTFGQTDATTGIWKPKTAPSVTYGTNGFFLKFASSGSMGTDSSGNGNDFTVNGTLTQTQDTPSNVFATLNPLLDVNNSPTFSNGNTTATGSSSGTARFTGSNLCVSKGKWYYEVKVTVSGSNPYVGVIDAQSNLRRDGIYFVDAASGVNDSGYAVNMSGDIYHNNSNSYATNIGSVSTGDILGFAIDLDSAQRTCEIYKNGTSQRSFNLAEPSSGAYMLACSSTYNEASAKAEVNFGNGYFGTTAVSSAQSPSDGIGLFEYAVPSGYKALCTKSINSQEYS